MTKLIFQLDVEDGWPPVAAEVMECTLVDKSFRIESAPLFLKGLSVGDLIIAAPDEEGRVWDWEHLAKSDRTTIWLARLSPAAQGEIDATLSKLRALGCNITSSQMLGCFAVDVPADCSIEEVDGCLATLAPDRVAVAFPSFRHDEGETEES
jgi:hypothetical protein